MIELARRTSTVGRQSPRAYRQRGVTLVELLIVVTIIGILATLMLGVGAVAGQTARKARTQAMVGRLHTLLVEQLDAYRSRRVEVAQGVLNTIRNAALGVPAGSSLGRERGLATAEVRLYALRELMLLEMPQRWSDISLEPIPNTIADRTDDGASVPQIPPVYLAERPNLSQVYWRRYNAIAESLEALDSTDTDSDGVKDSTEALLANESSECLYLFIATASSDGEGRSLFKESEVGDTDGDGAPEFLDGWGRPIEFIRWAPAFGSQVQINAALFDANNNGTLGPSELEEWKSAAAADHDPLDIFRRDPYAYRLIPLVISAGADGEFGVALPTELPLAAELPRPSTEPPAAWRPAASFGLGVVDTGVSPVDGYRVTESFRLDPYPRARTVPGFATIRSQAADNVHNHLISTRAGR